MAGPIKGSDRWQDEAIRYLQEHAPELNVASPRRSLDRARDYTEEDYIAQVDWESDHLRIAATKGVIVFFFAKETQHFCDRPFARTTRIEYGEWMTFHAIAGDKVVVGFEPGFDGDKYIRHRLQSYPSIPVFESLKETLDGAIAEQKRIPKPTRAGKAGTQVGEALVEMVRWMYKNKTAGNFYRALLRPLILDMREHGLL